MGALLTPKTDDPEQQQSQAILKFLPLMIGWFSLNVPSGLGLYWMTNNIVTTATTLLIRRSVAMPDLAPAGGGGAMPAEPPKSQGFGRRYGEIIETESSGAKITIKPPGAQPSSSSALETGAIASASPVTVVEADGPVVEAVAVPSNGSGDDVQAAASRKKVRKKKKKGKK